MTAPCFTREMLRRIRNEIPIDQLISDKLEWPSKWREKQFSFVCPCCGESRTATNPRTNLGRCFLCKRNFNPIDFVILAKECDFLDAITFLIPLLPPLKVDRSEHGYQTITSAPSDT